ncbi:MAG: hypothetical protein RL417_2504 [Pseudomonadota bacterium]|jgi:peptide-methionine (R)-S-oxide reductase
MAETFPKGHPTAPPHLQGIDCDAEDWRSKDDDYWRTVLSADQFAVCRRAGTERPFSGTYCERKEPGRYRCVCCGASLFEAATKFDSGTGWPSFTTPLAPEAVVSIPDYSHGMIRVEVRCKRCNAHLGHVFEDGPPPTGQRYCINSVCLIHEPLR